MTPERKRIRINCPKCKRTELVKRESCDYPDAVRIDIVCPRCWDGDFSEDFYYDKKGNHITRDPLEQP